jgi:hypothetical protein
MLKDSDVIVSPTKFYTRALVSTFKAVEFTIPIIGDKRLWAEKHPSW